jgi:hypothetical protein
MELGFHVDGKENIYLRIPTMWDEVNKQWIGFIKLPESQRLITGKGKTSFDLQNDFNVELSKVFSEGGEDADELFGMFMPSFYWEK